MQRLMISVAMAVVVLAGVDCGGSTDFELTGDAATDGSRAPDTSSSGHDSGDRDAASHAEASTHKEAGILDARTVAEGGSRDSDTIGDSEKTADAPIPHDSGPHDSGTGHDSGPPDSGTGHDSGPPDSGTGHDAGTPFDVASVPGLALWLNASVGVTASGTSHVSVWADQSGNHNDASELDATYQPMLVASSIDHLPAVHFTASVGGGTMMTIADSSTLEWSTGDYLIAVVTRYDNRPSATPATEAAIGYGTLFSKQVNGGGVALFANTPASGGAAGSTAFSSYVSAMGGVSNTALGFNDGTARLLATARTMGTTLALRVNGSQTATGAVPSVDVDEPFVGARLGASGETLVQQLDGDIAEMIAVKGALAPGDLAGIEAYLMTKYGL
jgi:hypothetical protein